MVLLLPGAVLELSVAHNHATGKQARTIRDGNKGCYAILWKSCHQRVQGKVGRHEPLVFPRLLFLGRDKTHVEWVRAFTAIFDDMKQYVMEHHTTGLVWNAKARKSTRLPAVHGLIGYYIIGHIHLRVQGLSITRRRRRRRRRWCSASATTTTASTSWVAAAGYLYSPRRSSCWWCCGSVCRA